MNHITTKYLAEKLYGLRNIFDKSTLDRVYQICGIDLQFTSVDHISIALDCNPSVVPSLERLIENSKLSRPSIKKDIHRSDRNWRSRKSRNSPR